MLGLHHVIALIHSHGLDHGLIRQDVEVDGPADQEFADVLQGDGELLAGMVLDDDPAGGHVDDLTPGALGREVGQSHGLRDHLVEHEGLLAGDSIDDLPAPFPEHRDRGHDRPRTAQSDQSGPEPA